MSRVPMHSLGGLRRVVSAPLLPDPPTASHRLAARLRTELKVDKRLPSLVHLNLVSLERAGQQRENGASSARAAGIRSEPCALGATARDMWRR